MKKPSGKSGKATLEADEDQLWEHTAQSIKPLKRGKARVHVRGIDPEAVAPRSRETKGAVDSKPVAAKEPKSKSAQKVELPKLQPKAIPPVSEFDRKAAKKIRGGRIEIEARIDLHGMRQSEAHSALIAFLRRAQSKDQRWVLVITGKGRAGPDDDARPFDMTRERDRGVLKRNVPRWLEEPELRAIVVSYTTAAISHGGDGALYVHVRKQG